MIGIGIGHVAADGDSCVIDKHCDARIIAQQVFNLGEILAAAC